MDFKHVSDKIYADTEDRERMEAMNKLYFEMADLIKNQMPNVYREYSEKAADILWSISPEEAQSIVRDMRPSGERWTISDVNSFVEAKGISPSINYYLTMNMAFNDYRNTASQFNVDNAEFYFSIANDFINDEDASSHKVEKYFKEM